MADDYSDILESLVQSIATAAKMTVADARATLAVTGPLVLQWTQEASAADAAGNAALAGKKRLSVQHVKAAVALEVAQRGVEAQAAVESAVLSAFDRAIGALA